MIRENKKKVLILGASGLVGRPLFRKLGERAIGTYCNKPVEHGIYFDALRMGLEEILERPQDISHAVITLGESDPQKCPVNPSGTEELNVHRVERMIPVLKRYAIKPIFCSSEYVFDGKDGGYTEESKPNPVIVYGHQKLAVEKFLKKTCEDFVTLRLSKVVTAVLDDGRLFGRWLEMLDQSSVLRCANDQVFSPIFIDDLVEAIIRIIDRDVNGIFHMSGPKSYVRIDLLEVLIHAVQKIERISIKIEPCSINDFGLPEAMPLNVSMSPEKSIRLLDLKLTSMNTVCDQIVRKKFLLQNQREEAKG